MKFDITNRWTNAVIFTAEIECGEDTSFSIKLGLAVKKAVEARANLADANLAYAYLAGANLAGANLADAYLAGANLAGANLADANLAYANLADAYLAGANLAGANLADANLAYAYLAGANLADANLAGANLADANLAYANLADANLADANLAGANLADGVKVFDYTFYRAPIQISDKYFINLWDGFLTIGCERHLVSEWEAFEDRDILEMDGKEALTWWKVWKPVLIGMAKSTGRENLPEAKGE